MPPSGGAIKLGWFRQDGEVDDASAATCLVGVVLAEDGAEEFDNGLAVQKGCVVRIMSLS